LKAPFKIVVWLAGTALLIVALGMALASFRAFRQIDETSEARTHTRIVINNAIDLLSELKDAETGQRGFSLTGNEAFLEPYLKVRDHITAHQQALRQLVLIPAAVKHLDAMESLIDDKMAELAQVIELRRRHDMAAVIAAVSNGRGKRLMDAIRAEMADFILIEEAAQAQYEAEFQSNMRNLLGLIVAASLFALLLALAFVWFIYRESRQRLKDLVHLETLHLLKLQEETNQQLQQANATLQVSEEKLDVTLNSIGDAVIATDAEARVTFLNPVAAQLTGWTRNSAIGHSVAEVFHIINQETRLPATIPVLATLAHGTVQGLANHTVLIARDGSECAIADSCAPIRNRAGQVVGAVLVFRDVTAEYAVQKELHDKNTELEIARAEADKANLAKSDFLSSMSHELRTPLNAILGFAQLLETDIPPPTPAQKGNVTQILQAGWHLLKLINEILDLVKIESGRVPLSQEPVLLAEVMRECQSMVEPQAQQRGIKLTFPRFDIPHFARADRIRVKQVLINLLSNAIKYNVKQGTVTVTCSENVPGRIRISIKDSGEGLPPEQLAQLFQPFNRLGQEAGAEEGTGIGLVVAKRLVELMGGSIGVESTVGTGSVFWFELLSVAEPHLLLEEVDATVALLQPDAPRKMGLHTLLYVEDNPANLKLVEYIIARHPEITLLSAVNGDSGVEIARISLPDVILMDINLPGINGFEAMRILRADPTTAHIPIIAISANAMPLEVEKGLKAGFFRYITKPIKVDEFMAALNVALEFADTHSARITI